MEALLNRRLMEAVRNMDVDTLHELGQARGSSQCRLDVSEALCLGARTAHVETVRLLLRMKADVTYTDRDGRRALHYAAEMGSVEIAKLIINAGSPVNVPNTQGATALHYATEAGHTDTVLLLLTEGAQVNRPRTYHNGETPLHTASKGGRTEICKLFIARGADINAVASFSLLTPLILAVKSRSLFTVRLLCKMGCDINKADNKGRTAVHYAVEVLSLAMAEELLAHGANPSIADKRGQTPLHLLASSVSSGTSHRAKLAERLIQFRNHINQTDCEGMTPLHMAALVGNVDVAALLVTGGADINFPDLGRGETPLNVAVGHDRIDVVRLLLMLGADVSLGDLGQVTPLHNIMGSRSVYKVVIGDLLIGHGARINAVTLRGHTPLDRCVFHYVIGSSNRAILKMLVVAGAHLRPLVTPGRPLRNSPLCWLTWHGELESAQFLVDAGWNLQNEQWISLPGKDEATHQFMGRLKCLAQQPNSLWATCRNSIRCHLNSAGDDQDISPSVHALPLPTFLKRHLLLESEASMLKTSEVG